MSKKKLNILGIIPARSGSKRLPKKNELKIGGISLLERSITAAKKSKYINRLIFSTESIEYIKLVKNLDIEVPFVRPDSLAKDNSSSWDVVRHAVSFMADNKKFIADIVVLLQPNCPFRTTKHIDDVIDIVLSGANAALSIKKVDYPLEWMFRIDREGTLKNIIKNENVNRMQDSQVTYQPNGAVYALKTTLLKNKLPMPNNGTRTLEMDFEESINIDEYWDYELAKIIYKRKYD